MTGARRLNAYAYENGKMVRKKLYIQSNTPIVFGQEAHAVCTAGQYAYASLNFGALTTTRVTVSLDAPGSSSATNGVIATLVCFRATLEGLYMGGQYLGDLYIDESNWNVSPYTGTIRTDPVKSVQGIQTVLEFTTPSATPIKKIKIVMKITGVDNPKNYCYRRVEYDFTTAE